LKGEQDHHNLFGSKDPAPYVKALRKMTSGEFFRRHAIEMGGLFCETLPLYHKQL
jgi:hypothetical protein